MRDSDRVKKILAALKRAYSDAECALTHRSALQLLIATILSAQCTDERVNKVTPELFRRWPDATALAGAKQADVERVIHSTGFFHSKAKSIVTACRTMVERYGGEVPRTMEELLTLRGVARKTANVVLGTWFGKSDGVVVDTHVLRISHRLGLTSNRDNPVKTERELMTILPKRAWIMYSHRIIHHGRKICKAIRPRCDDCPLEKLCPKRGI